MAMLAPGATSMMAGSRQPRTGKQLAAARRDRGWPDSHVHFPANPGTDAGRPGSGGVAFGRKIRQQDSGPTGAQGGALIRRSAHLAASAAASRDKQAMRHCPARDRHRNKPSRYGFCSRQSCHTCLGCWRWPRDQDLTFLNLRSSALNICSFPSHLPIAPAATPRDAPKSRLSSQTPREIAAGISGRRRNWPLALRVRPARGWLRELCDTSAAAASRLSTSRLCTVLAASHVLGTGPSTAAANNTPAAS
jgi:hypothetical protein